MSREYDVIVIGGGLHGCSTALHLALRGQRVAVGRGETCGGEPRSTGRARVGTAAPLSFYPPRVGSLTAAAAGSNRPAPRSRLRPPRETRPPRPRLPMNSARNHPQSLP